jgi:hypothetical protein
MDLTNCTRMYILKVERLSSKKEELVKNAKWLLENKLPDNFDVEGFNSLSKEVDRLEIEINLMKELFGYEEI